MLHIFSTALNAVLPILLLTVLGYWLKRIGFLSEQFVKIGNKIVFHICLSCTLFINVYDIDDFSSVAWDVVIYALLAVCFLFLIGIFVAMLTTKEPAKRGVMLHGIFRSNYAIIGLSLAAALGGDEAMAIASVISAFAMPLYNILGVVSLTIFSGGERKISAKEYILPILKNPMILGAAAGALCILIRKLQVLAFGNVIISLEEDLSFVFQAVSKLTLMTTPLALMVMGAQFEFSAVKGLVKEILVGSLWRIVFAPLIGIGLAFILSKHTGLLACDAASYPALIALFGSPAAVSTAVVASEMGGDEQLATQIVVWTSLCSVFTIYITVCIMMATGLLIV